MKRWTIRKAGSFAEADALEDRYYRERSHEDRLSDVQRCREYFLKMKGIDGDEVRKGLRRVFTIVQRS